MSRTLHVVYGATRDGVPGVFHFEGLLSQVTAIDAHEVVPALEKIEMLVRDGAHAAGFIAYEASTGFDASLTTLPLTGFPLLWFGIFQDRYFIPLAEWLDATENLSYETTEWHPDLCRDQYVAGVERIRDYIAAGDVYQVNLTFSESFDFAGEARAFFHDLCRSQTTPYCSFIDLDRFSILSASPELFFELDNGVLTVRPMKGTAKRGTSVQNDAEIVDKLRHNDKERAENLMIVDLLRNDLGRVSENGSVKVDSLFDVEALGTVHQMTSTVSSRVRADMGLADLLRALFPCGSITGAPKKRSMEIIAEIEGSPRGVYTGCVGYISPGMLHAVFSVAIRTVVIDKEAGRGTLGVGSGITWYSDPDAEFEECRAKGLFAREIPPDFKLIESLLHEKENGLFLLARHLERLAHSASYFGFSFDYNLVRSMVEDFTRGIEGNCKVRLLLSRDGSLDLEHESLGSGAGPSSSCIAFAEMPVDSTNPFLYHKTSNRRQYLEELAKRPDCLDVIFLNERGEVTEGASNNIVIRKAGTLLTPQVTCGLLPGTFRAQLLESGIIVEDIVTRADLLEAEEIFLINSVRRWRRVRFAEGVVQC